MAGKTQFDQWRNPRNRYATGRALQAVDPRQWDAGGLKVRSTFGRIRHLPSVQHAIYPNECVWTLRFEKKEPTPQEKLKAEFMQLAEAWHKAVRFSSSMKKRIFHPAYQRIIGLGPDAVPLILRELRDRPNHWFWALSSITGADPAAGTETLEEARAAWLEWGNAQNLIPD